MRMGFNQDQIKVVVNSYTKKVKPHHASLEQIQQTLNQPVFYGIPSTPAVTRLDQQGAAVRGRSRSSAGIRQGVPAVRGQGDGREEGSAVRQRPQ